jgi:hypothetical protein
VKRTAIVLLLGLAGCSTFNRDFEAVTFSGLSSSGVSDLTGRWEGTWQSDENGHTGMLRCIITRNDSDYLARYYATYTWWCLPMSFEYVIPTTAQPEGPAKALGGVWKLRGSAELSCWVAGGLYEYEARVENGEYVATYRSDFDRGVFRMKRVK